MVFISTRLKVFSAIVFVSLPSISALPTTSSSQQSASIVPVQIRAPTTNIKSNYIALALDKRSTHNIPKGKGTKPLSNANAPTKKVPAPKAKPKGQPKSSGRGANTGRPSGKAPSKRKTQNAVKRPNARPPSGPKISSAKEVKRPNGRVPPKQKVEGKPQKPARPPYKYSGKPGNRGPIYAMHIGENVRYDAEMDENSEDDAE